MKKGLVIMLGLMTVAFLAACEKEPVNNNPEDGDNQDQIDDPNAHEDNSPEPPANQVPPVTTPEPPVDN